MLIFVIFKNFEVLVTAPAVAWISGATMLLTIGDVFTWNDTTWLSHWSQPATAAAIYLLACGIHNSRLRKKKREPANAAAKNAESPSTPLLDAAAVAHNVVLVAFSALVCIIATYHFVERVAKAGLHNVLCPPPLPATSAAAHRSPAVCIIGATSFT